MGLIDDKYDVNSNLKFVEGQTNSLMKVADNLPPNTAQNVLGKKTFKEIAEAKANIEIYMNNPVGIGEHPDVIDAIHSQVLKIASAEENIQVIQQHFVDQKVI